MELKVLDITGNDTGKKVELAEEIFGIEPNDHVLYLDVKPLDPWSAYKPGHHRSKPR